MSLANGGGARAELGNNAHESHLVGLVQNVANDAQRPDGQAAQEEGGGQSPVSKGRHYSVERRMFKNSVSGSCFCAPRFCESRYIRI
jgi:hypothetical protein